MEDISNSLVIELLRKQGEEQQRIAQSLQAQKVTLEKLSQNLNSLLVGNAPDIPLPKSQTVVLSSSSAIRGESIPPPKERKGLLQHFNDTARKVERRKGGPVASCISRREFLDLKVSFFLAFFSHFLAQTFLTIPANLLFQ